MRETEDETPRHRMRHRGLNTATPEGEGLKMRENQRKSMRDLEVLSSIVPITTTSTGDSE